MKTGFEIVVLSAPHLLEDEAQIITELFEAGLQHFHLRKTESTEEEAYKLIEKIPRKHYNKLVWHISTPYSPPDCIKKLHTSKPTNFALNRWHSIGIHNKSDLNWVPKNAKYVFCSPIFDSISKAGYKGNAKWLAPFKSKHKLFALGGVTNENISQLLEQPQWKGAALLGHIWEKPQEAVKRFNKLQEKTNG